MRILCVETEPEHAAGVADRLRAGGHEVVGCFEDADPGRPCVRVTRPGACPLDDAAGVDVVLDVRSAEAARPTAREVGVVCALRQNVPLAVMPPMHPNPFAGVTAAVAEPDDPEVGCVAAVQRHRDAMGTQVSDAAAGWMGERYAPGRDVHTDVRRSAGELQVVIHRPPEAGSHDGAVAVRVHQMLRASGERASRLSIGFADQE